MLWGTVFCYFVFSGRVSMYLHPAFHWIAMVAGIAMVVIACLVLVLPFDPDAGCGPAGDRTHRATRVIMSFILVVPLLVAVRSSPSEFGATTVLNRGFITSVSQLPYAVTLPDESLPGEAWGDSGGSLMDYLTRNEDGQIVTEAIDLLYASEEPTLRPDFEGQGVELIGQFLPAGADTSPDRFRLVRLFILCCAADAQPMAVLIEPEVAAEFPKMQWLRVTGTATFPEENGSIIPVVKNATATPIETPEATFVY